MYRENLPENKLGFTLIELMVVVAILVILSVIAITIYRTLPLKARDSSRLQDLDSIYKAVSILTLDSDGVPGLFCAGATPPCNGSSYPNTAANRKTDGTGWIKINFDSQTSANFTLLPIDPLNSVTYNYTYSSDGTNWKVMTTMESSTYAHLMTDDGGTDDAKFEVGSNIKVY